MLFVIGATWPGKCIIGTVYAMEFYPLSMQKSVLFVILILNAISISAIPLSFQVQ